jgi:membrane protease YdiL (CAAX protease family)
LTNHKRRLAEKPYFEGFLAHFGKTFVKEYIMTHLVGGFVLLAAMSLLSGQTGEDNLTAGWALLDFLLIAALGTVGVAAEKALPVDLFPEFRRREVRRIVYVVVAALFVDMLARFWGFLFGGFAQGIGRALGEAVPDTQGAASSLYMANPLVLFLNLLIGAGLFEELLFRVGIMTLVWALTRRWWIGLLISALFFGLYHISPLSGISAANLAAPITVVLTSFGMGLATGVIYRYRGFAMAVLTHTLGDWLLVLLLASMKA